MQSFTLALAQMSPRLGLIDENLTRVVALGEQAAAQKADLVVFPELCLTGYFLRDLAREVALRPEDPRLAPLYRLSRQLDLLVSFVEQAPEGRVHIAAGYFSGGVLTHLHRKVYLPTYGMFEDARFFSPGARLGAFDTRLGRMAVLICEDFWHPSSAWLATLDGAEVILAPSASPARAPQDGAFSNTLWIKNLCALTSGSYGVYSAFCNRVGYEDGVGFAGGSLLTGPDGGLLAEAPLLEESLTLTHLDAASLRRERLHLPLLRDEDPHFLHRELARILKQQEHRHE